MATYRLVYDSHHLQADCQGPGSAPEPYARQSSTGCLYLRIVIQNDAEDRGYIRKRSVPKIIMNNTIKLFLNCDQHFVNFKPYQFPSAV